MPSVYGTGPVAVGSALVQAKETYLGRATSLRGIDIKSLLESTLYGLPMIRVNLPAGRITPPSDTSIAAPAAAPAGTPGETLGLSSATVNLSPALSTETKPLQTTGGGPAPTATYLEGSDGVVTSPGAPALPLDTRNVTVSGQVLRGVGFTGGTYTDQTGVTPLTGAPATELNGLHSTFASSAFFPSRLWTVNYFGGLTGGSTAAQLMLTPVQYKSDAPGSLTDIQRTFSTVGLRLFYSANTATYAANTPALAAPPTISRIDASATGTAVGFDAHVVGDPAAGIQEVWVTYTGVHPGQWESLALTQDLTDSTLWHGNLPGLTPPQIAGLQFIVQAVNGVGVVSLDDNIGSYYRPGQIPPALQASGPAITATALALGSPPASGGFGSSVALSATLAAEGGAPVSGQPVRFTIGGSTVDAVTGPGGVAHANLMLADLPGDHYHLTVAFAGTNTLGSATDAAPFAIDRVGTTLTAASEPAVIQAGVDTGITVTLRGRGVGLVGYPVAFVLTPTGGTPGSPVVRYETTGPGGVGSLGPISHLPGGTYSVRAFFGPAAPVTLPEDPILEGSASTSFGVLAHEAPAIQSASSTIFTVGTPGNFTVTTTGLPVNTIGNGFTGCTSTLPGTLNFTDHGDNTARLTGTPTSAGIFTVCIKASNGVGTAATQTFTLTVARQATATAISSNIDPVNPKTAVTYTATVVPAPGSGTVTFHADGASIPSCTALALSPAGRATCTQTYNTAGNHAIYATYNPAANYLGSTSPTLGETVASCGTTLQGCNLHNANLQGADLHGTNLKNANLSGAKLQGANLQGANLQGANLNGANLNGAGLQGANLRTANLHNASLSGVTWSNTTCPDGTNSNNDSGSCANNL